MDASRFAYTVADRMAECLCTVFITVWWRRGKTWWIHLYWLTWVKLAYLLLVIFNVFPWFEADFAEMETTGMISVSRIGPFLYLVALCAFGFYRAMLYFYPAVMIYQLAVLVDPYMTEKLEDKSYLMKIATDIINLVPYMVLNYLLDMFFTGLTVAKFTANKQQQDIKEVFMQSPDGVIVYQLPKYDNSNAETLT